MEPPRVLKMLVECKMILDGSMEMQGAGNGNRKDQMWVNIKCIKQ